MNDGDGIEWLGDEDSHDGRRRTRVAQLLRRWAGWLAAVSALAAAALALVAANLLADANLGTSLRARACDLSPVWPLALFTAAGVLASLTPRLALLRMPTTITSWRPGVAAIAAIVPLGLLAFSLPGTLGCGAARTIARWQLFGDSLTGSAGVALCVASAFGLGAAFAFVLHVGIVRGTTDLDREQPTIVELAIQEAAELERDAELRRFRGVD